ncbi:O-antigen ligase family protein [Heyndrickxia ginsengihumi]|uniref:O-antigen ligase family protein n=1 Tax=Heyndrickxia ginsengihumi TaxID=363870 RepID=UPI003D241180
MTAIILILLLIWGIREKYEKIFFIFIFINLVIPLNTNLESKILFLDNNVLDTRLWVLIFMIILMIIKKSNLNFRTNINQTIFIGVFICLTAVGVLIGYKNNNIYLINDTKLFIKWIITYFVFFQWIILFKIDYKKVLRGFVVGGFIYACLTIVLYLFFRGSFLISIYGPIYGSIWADRITFPNNTAQYVVIFISFYLVYKKEKIKFNVFSIILNFISIFLSQNRTLIIIGTAMFILTSIIFFILGILKRKITLQFLGFTFISIPILLFIAAFISRTSFFKSNTLVKQIIDRFSNEGLGTVSYRIYTNEYAIRSVNSPILGDGLGKALMSGGMSFNRYLVSFVDNAFINIYAKLGLVGLVMLFLFFFYSLYANLRAYIKSRNELYLIFILIIPGYIILSCYMTSQFLHSAPVYLAYFLFIILPDYINGSLKKN